MKFCVNNEHVPTESVQDVGGDRDRHPNPGKDFSPLQDKEMSLFTRLQKKSYE